MPNDNRPTWKPYLLYLQQYGDRKRAEGNPSPDIALESYLIERERNRELQ
jgi:hypothetical protein